MIYNRIKRITIFIILILFLTGCAQKITIKAVKPSIINDKDIKNIYIDVLNNDYINLSSNIKYGLDNVYFENKKYFKVYNKLTLNSKSILTSRVNSTKFVKNYYYENRTNRDICMEYKKYKNGKSYCYRYFKYKVSCTKYTFFVNATLSVIKLSNDAIIYNRNYNKSSDYNMCIDDNKMKPDEIQVYKQISKQIANKFVSILSPSYNYFTTTTIDDPDISYTKNQLKLLSNGLKLIKKHSIKNANKIFKELVLSTKIKSYTALYNFGLTEEMLGRLDNAYVVYNKAQDLSLKTKINDNILDAVKRISMTKVDKKKTINFINE